MLCSDYNRVECWRPFLSGQNRSTNQRSGMIFEVQNRRFSARARARGVHRRMQMHSKVIILKKIPGGFKINTFLWEWAKSFLLP